MKTSNQQTFTCRRWHWEWFHQWWGHLCPMLSTNGGTAQCKKVQRFRVKDVKGGARIREISKVMQSDIQVSGNQRKACWLQAHDIHDYYISSKCLLNRGSYIMANIKTGTKTTTQPHKILQLQWKKSKTYPGKQIQEYHYFPKTWICYGKSMSGYNM